ncbi:sensor histidine kinase [Nonomuraea sp. NPDC050536]|uniref:sensor histidine kinase n=1 Tax=Nonomuraea sp. NPDC050536 TaxID=3364366 RepID=UPI0037C6F554
MSEIRPPRPAAMAGVIASVGVLAAVTLWARASTHTSMLGLDIAVAAVSLVAALAQLWWPVAGALVATLLAVVSPVATPAATLGALQVARRRRLPAAAAVAAAGIAAHLVQGLWRPNAGISLGWWLVLTGVGYGALLGWGALAQARHALLISLRERAHRAEAEQGRRIAEARMAERNKLAREMHDVLAHRLSLVATHAGAMEYRPDSSPEQLARAAGVVRAGVHQALEELRQVISLLRDEDDGHDVDKAQQPTLEDLPGLVVEARQAGDQVRLQDEVVDADSLPAAAARTVFRLVQEGLTNARKHAHGQPVEVLLHGSPGTRLLITVRNPLPEKGSAPTTPGSGTGLIGLTERVRLAGGQLDHHAAGGEFRLQAWLPWPA